MKKGIQPKLTKDSNATIMKYIKHHMDDFNIQFNNSKFIRFLHDSMMKVKSNMRNVHTEENFTIIDEENPISIQSSYFLDKFIVDDIKLNMEMIYRARLVIHDTFIFTINIFFNRRQNVNIRKMMYYIKFLLCLSLQHYRNEKERHNFNISIYLSDIKKGIASGFKNIIESKHINSGYYYYDPTNDTSNIVVFRREEWYKTLVHECVHCFNLDFQSVKISYKILMSDLFFIQSEMKMNEAFTEFWARTLNCAILTFHGIESDNFTDFNHIFSINLNIERVHSLNQGMKLLRMFGLPYSSIIDPEMKSMTEKVYKEKTNAFCYYVMTSILMYNFDNTLQWFTNNEYNTISFEKTERQIMIFCYYLKQVSRSSELLQTMDKIANTKVPVKNMKMSIFELGA